MVRKITRLGKKNKNDKEKKKHSHHKIKIKIKIKDFTLLKLFFYITIFLRKIYITTSIILYILLFLKD